ncbi:PREDICTED: mucin-17-like [Thamnophis sirtalis]|uniref:Mucin-17-like n=1 Tax=Thamnophis sirtalis TaxID=35019 RepID=A0A6I9XTL6_9SAUR|nr:PREDICTED: mucin-17-like [Thamnophis sirtalis]
MIPTHTISTLETSSPSTVSITTGFPKPSTLKTTSIRTIPHTSTMSTHFTESSETTLTATASTSTASTVRRSSTPKTTETTSLSVTTRTTESAKTTSYEPIISEKVPSTFQTRPSIQNQTIIGSTVTPYFTGKYIRFKTTKRNFRIL